MISVTEALAQIASLAPSPSSEVVSLSEARGRVLAAPVTARRNHPPATVSSMDGYAVRAAEANAGTVLRVQGESAAGGAAPAPLLPGHAMRIFTGAEVPEGADAVLIQENAGRDGDSISVAAAPAAGRYLRRKSLDFAEGEELLSAGLRLEPRHLGLAAAGDCPYLRVARRPRVALLANGDELARPGEARSERAVIASSFFSLAASVRDWGGEPIDLGIARDDLEDLQRRLEAGLSADLVVTVGGASVGDHDRMRDALDAIGLNLGFWKVAMRPGKPMMAGRVGGVPFLGFPGNPVSTLVCAELFLKPLLFRMTGATDVGHRLLRARLGAPVPANDLRQDYLRSTLREDDKGLIATPFAPQDSSMLATLARADGLIVRLPHAAAAGEGEVVDVLPLAGAWPYSAP